MKTTKLITGTAIALFFLGCGQSREEAMSPLESRMSRDSLFISSSAAVENKNDKDRKFIRTADLKFKVKNVIQSTYDIENITSRNGGFVTYTRLSSDVSHVSHVPVSADSTLESTWYTVSNSIILRVPNVKLDTTLKEIARNITFLDFRLIKADDVALKMYSNKLIQKRSKKNEERLENAIDNRGKKLYETTSAEELLLNKQEKSDQAEINNLSLQDQVEYSTITIYLYQRPDIKKELIANERNIDEYKPGLRIRIAESLREGWKVVELLIVFLFRIWWLLILSLAGFIIYKRFKRNKKP